MAGKLFEKKGISSERSLFFHSAEFYYYLKERKWLSPILLKATFQKEVYYDLYLNIIEVVYVTVPALFLLCLVVLESSSRYQNMRV